MKVDLGHAPIYGYVISDKGIEKSSVRKTAFII